MSLEELEGRLTLTLDELSHSSFDDNDFSYAKQNAMLIRMGILTSVSGVPSKQIVDSVKENVGSALISRCKIIRELAKLIEGEQSLAR